MITLFLFILIHKAIKIRKAWRYSKALCDKDYILNEAKDFGLMYVTVCIIWLSIKCDLVPILFNFIW